MKFLVHAHVNQASAAEELGVADYNYFFLLQAFSQILTRLGEVAILQEPNEADAIYAHCQASGEGCLLLSFAPPHRTPLNLACPVIPVFAWAYPDIPGRLEEACWLGDPRNDWRHVFSRTGKAIALSGYAADMVKCRMGNGFAIAAIPPPLEPEPDSRSHLKQSPLSQGDSIALRIQASVADSRRMGLSVDHLLCLDEDDGTPFRPEDDEKLPATRQVGQQNHKHADIEEDLPSELYMADESEPAICDWNLPPEMKVCTRLHGVVYTAVLMPSAPEQNWQDLITAFCSAFGDRSDATLLLKLDGEELTYYHHELLMVLTKMSPLRCRVIGIYGVLSDESYANLLAVTTYYVTASVCEGLCLPLVKFLNHGIPAIAPAHTAMTDYICDELAFQVKSYPGAPTPWPHGDGEVDRTSRQQLDWESLAEAYQQSHKVACREPARYAQMSRHAHQAMQSYCGPTVTLERLHAFLCPELPAPDQHPLPPLHETNHAIAQATS